MASGEATGGASAGRQAAGGALVGGEGYGSDTGGDITCGTGESVGGGESTLGDTEGVEDDASVGAVTCVLLLPLVILLVAALLSVCKVKSATITFAHRAMSGVAIVRDGVKGMATSCCRYIGGAPPSRMVRIRSARECDYSPFFISVVKVGMYWMFFQLSHRSPSCFYLKPNRHARIPWSPTAPATSPTTAAPTRATARNSRFALRTSLASAGLFAGGVVAPETPVACAVWFSTSMRPSSATWLPKSVRHRVQTSLHGLVVVVRC